jgi:hypothetical protein
MASCVTAPRNPGARSVMLVPGNCSRARDRSMRMAVDIPLSFVVLYVQFEGSSPSVGHKHVEISRQARRPKWLF